MLAGIKWMIELIGHILAPFIGIRPSSLDSECQRAKQDTHKILDAIRQNDMTLYIALRKITRRGTDSGDDH